MGLGDDMDMEKDEYIEESMEEDGNNAEGMKVDENNKLMEALVDEDI